LFGFENAKVAKSAKPRVHEPVHCSQITNHKSLLTIHKKTYLCRPKVEPLISRRKERNNENKDK
jgi:hypothetical protein